MTPEYITNSIVWSGLGLLVGFVLGAGYQVRFLYWKLDEKKRDRAVASFLIIIALVSTIQGLSFQRNQREISDCQFRFNARFQEVLQERAAIGDRDRQNVTEMISTVLNAKTREAQRAALEKYVRVNNELEQQRSDNPFPAITSNSCKKEKK